MNFDPFKQERFLIDSSVFFEAQNRLYLFDFCMPFWDIISKGHGKGFIYSTTSVKNEILNGVKKNDMVKLWADQLPPEFFIDDRNNQSVILTYQNLMNWAHSGEHKYSDEAKVEFASDAADARLIATAKIFGYTIVTQEKSAPNSIKSIKIPEPARHFGVKCLFVHEMLQKICQQNFTLKAQFNMVSKNMPS